MGSSSSRTAGEVIGAGRPERLSRECEVAGAFELERTQVRMAAHQHHLHDRVVEGGMSLLRHDGQVSRNFAP